MQNQEIPLEGDLRMSVSQSLDPAALALLSKTVYGTAGVRYQHTGQHTKVSALGNPLFFRLWRGAELVGMYCLDERPIELAGHSLPGFYGRYLAVADHHAGQGYGRLLKQQAVAYVEGRTSSPFLFYSYIEQKNSRSLSISAKEGFSSIATLRTYIFRRYAPKLDKRFATATKTDLANLMPMLDRFYRHYRLKTWAHVGYQDNYFVLKEGGNVVAGVQANPVEWRFHDMPGLKGKAIMYLAPLLLATRRLFDPHSYRFVVLEGLYLADDRQHLLPVLLESVLSHFGLYSAMWLIDETDPLTARLADQSMGLMSGYKSDVQTRVMVKAIGVSPPWLATADPVYVSCFDYS